MRILIVMTLIGQTFLSHAASHQVSSPDGKLTVTMRDDSGKPSYTVSFNGQNIIQDSGLGLVFKQQAPFTEGFQITNIKRESVDQSWEQPWGERRLIRDAHNELLVTLENPNLTVGKESNEGFFESLFSGANNSMSAEYKVRVRVFNDGLGFRYEVPTQVGYETVEIVKENLSG